MIWRCRGPSRWHSYRHRTCLLALGRNLPEAPPRSGHRTIHTAKDDASKPALLFRHAQLQDKKGQDEEKDEEDEEDARVSQKHHGTRVQGLVRSIRKQSRVAFAHIQDGSTYRPIQAVLSPELATYVTNGAYVDMTGHWQKSRAKGQSYELQVAHINHIGESAPDDYPIQKHSMSSEYLRKIPHLRMRSSLQSLVARTRGHVTRSVQDYFSNIEVGSEEVHPPLVTSSDCEGAGEVFTVAPLSNAAKQATIGQTTSTEEVHFFREPKYLTVSSQLHLEAYAAELGNVWALSPTFRAENSDTSRHLAEFYMLEAEYRGITDLETVQRHATVVIDWIVERLSAHRTGQELLEFYADTKHRPSDFQEPNLEDRWARITRAPGHGSRTLQGDWPTVSWSDAHRELLAAYEADSAVFTDKPNWNAGPSLQQERWIVENLGKGFATIINHYPASIKPFYMLPSNTSTTDPDDPKSTVACFDILLPYGYAEVCGGSLREHRLPNLIDAMRSKRLLKHAKHPTESDYPCLRRGESLGSLQWYADLRRYGSSPHGGFGMGFDRLLAYLTGVSNVKDVVGFPRSWGRADC